MKNFNRAPVNWNRICFAIFGALYFIDPINALHFNMKCCRKHNLWNRALLISLQRKTNKQINLLDSPSIRTMLAYFSDVISTVGSWALLTVRRLSWVILCTQLYSHQQMQFVECKKIHSNNSNGAFAPWKCRTSLDTNHTLIASDTTNR